MADLEIGREEVKGQRYNITETAPAASFIMSHLYDLAIVSYVSSVNTQPSNLQHDVALSQLYEAYFSLIYSYGSRILI